MKKLAFMFTMLLSAFPVMAASTNSLTKSVSLIEGTSLSYEVKNLSDATSYEVGNADTELLINLDEKLSYDQTFYIYAIDGTFEKSAYTAWANGTTAYLNGQNIYNEAGEILTNATISTDTYEIKWLNNTQLEVTLKVADSSIYRLPVIIKAESGQPTLQIDALGTTLTGGKVQLSNGKIATQSLEVAAKNPTILSTEGFGNLGTLEINENLISALSGKVIRLELDTHSKLEFMRVQDELKIQGLKGYMNNINGAEFSLIVDDFDAQIAYLQIPELSQTTGIAGITIDNIKVRAEGRADVRLGDINVNIMTVEQVGSSRISEGLKNINLTLAEVKEDEVVISADKNQVIAGFEQTGINLSISDITGQVLTGRRNIFLVAEGGSFVVNGRKVNEIEVEVLAGQHNINANFDISTSVNDSGEFKVIAQSRDFQEDIETVVAQIIPAVTIDTTTLELVEAQKANAQGEIIINETSRGMLAQGKEIVIEVEDLSIESIEMETKNIDVEYTISNGKLYLEVVRQSKDNGQIIIKDIVLNVPRNAPLGEYNVMIGGDAISMHNNRSDFDDAIKIEGFVNINPQQQIVIIEPTPVVEQKEEKIEVAPKKEIISAMLHTKTGEAIVNGNLVVLDAKPYVSTSGYTMVGVRDLANFLNIPAENITFNNGVITINNNGSIITMQNNSALLNNNGKYIAMNDVVTIKDGRTYAPISYIAEALGFEVQTTGDIMTLTK
ncbi:MAG: hypothetical protein ATN36_05250 [Epulopiscium sp. Nele67-Bin005]|nr:MAG: hypothetical protein ATN36_05250 [Epulopiscium sp. Nele67-Bin005]